MLLSNFSAWRRRCLRLPVLLVATAFVVGALGADAPPVLAQGSAAPNGRVAPGNPVRAGYVRSGDQLVPATSLRSIGQRAGGGGPTAAPLSADSAFTKWTGGRVYYSYDSSMTPGRIRAFEQGCREWEKYADLQFAPRNGQPNYIRVVGSDVNTSYAGMLGGVQDLNLSLSADAATAEHELGHALGIIHEHQRPDRDDYVTILTENVDPNFIFAL